MARTGSGKTAAFLLPLLHRLRAHSPVSGARGLVISPTRELALQTLRFARDMSHFTDLRMCCLVGGDALDAQFEALAAAPDVLVATPGRLLHHLAEVEGMSLRTVEIAVLDEADRLFEMGFAEQIRDIFRGMSEARQTLLFSATLPHQLAEFAAAGLRQPVVVRLDEASKLPDALRLSFVSVRTGDKIAALLHVLRDVLRPGARALVFACTRHHVEMLATLLRADGVLCGAVYGAMDQAARRAAVARFRSGAAPVLVVTDVAARGIDIPLLDAAVNFDFPPTPKLFVHRVGRVARAGAAGDALSLVTRDDLGYLVDLHLFLGRALRVAPSPGQAPCAGLPGSDSDASLLGAVPPAALEAASERARVLVDENDDVRALLRVSANAFKQYCKTRPPASAESVRRGRELSVPGVHTMLLQTGALGNAGVAPAAPLAAPEEEALALFASRLGRYRPAATVLEAQVAPMRPAAGTLGDMMKAKRAAHGGAIAARISEARAVGETGAGAGRMAAPIAPLACGRFRDSSFFLDATPKPAHFAERGLSVRGDGAPAGGARALTDSVMDLMADDSEGAARARSLVQWDARKRRYVSLHGGDAEAAARRGNKKMRTESGALITGRNSGTEENATGLYKKWQAKTKMSVVRSDPLLARLRVACSRLLRCVPGCYRRCGYGAGRHAAPGRGAPRAWRPRPRLGSQRERARGAQKHPANHQAAARGGAQAGVRRRTRPGRRCREDRPRRRARLSRRRARPLCGRRARPLQLLQRPRRRPRRQQRPGWWQRRQGRGRTRRRTRPRPALNTLASRGISITSSERAQLPAAYAVALHHQLNAVVLPELHPVGDGDVRHPSARQLLVQAALLVRVDGARGLVQHGKLGRVIQQPREAKALALATAENVPPLFVHQVQAGGRLCELAEADRLQALQDALVEAALEARHGWVAQLLAERA